MPNFSEAVTSDFIAISIALIFIFIGIGVLLVKKFK
jgi:hypothetical protein